MKHFKVYVIFAVAFAILALVGSWYAGWFSPEDKSKNKTGRPSSAYKKAGPDQEYFIAGTINEIGQLVVNEEETFVVSENTEKGLKVKALIGQKVEIKGAFLEAGWATLVEVHDYTVLKE